MTQIRHNLKITLLESKDTLDEIHRLMNHIETYNAEDSQVTKILEDHEYNTYIKSTVLSHEEYYRKWLKREVEEKKVLMLDEDDATPDVAADVDLSGVKHTLKSLRNILEELELKS